jgi:hypothetical protein
VITDIEAHVQKELLAVNTKPFFKGDGRLWEDLLQLLIASAKFVSQHNSANPSDSVFVFEISHFTADSLQNIREQTRYAYISTGF